MVQVRQLGGCLCRHGRRVERSFDAPVSIIPRNRRFVDEVPAPSRSCGFLFNLAQATHSGVCTCVPRLSSHHVGMAARERRGRQRGRRNQATKQASKQASRVASTTLLAHCLASHLQGEPHGFEPPFCRHHSSQPRLTTTATGMASPRQVRPHLGVARDGHGLDELSRDACMTMCALGWTSSCASRIWHGSPSSRALQIFRTWTLIFLELSSWTFAHARHVSSTRAGLQDDSLLLLQHPSEGQHPVHSGQPTAITQGRLFHPTQTLAQDVGTPVQ